MRFFYALLLFVCASMPTVVSAKDFCSAGNLQTIIPVLDQGIALNEKFKASVNKEDQDQSRKLRKQNESYTEEKVMPCVRRAAQLLSVSSNTQLMRKLMEVVVSYENSADETISYSIGSVFSANPDAIEIGIKSFPTESRRLIAEAVRTGWINAKPKVDSAVVKDRNDRLKHLAD